MRVLIVSSHTIGADTMLTSELVAAGYRIDPMWVSSSNLQNIIPASEILNATHVEEATTVADDVSCACAVDKKTQVLFNLRPDSAGIYDITLLQGYFLAVLKNPQVMAVANMVDGPSLKKLFEGTAVNPCISFATPEALLSRGRLLNVPTAERLPSPPELRRAMV